MTVYLGIDWSEQKHDLCFLLPTGEVLRYLQIPHTPEGFAQLDRARRELGLTAGECWVGIETAHNLLVDYLWDQGYTQVTILPPQAVDSAQGRFRNSRAKSDPSDARLIADLLRTDGHRFRIWQPDSALTRDIRASVHYLYQLTKDSVRIQNRLRAVLLRYYPAALGLFSKLDSPLSTAFVQAYPTPQAASGLSWEDFTHFCRQHHHTRAQFWPASYNHLTARYPQADPGVIAAYAPQAVGWAELLAGIQTCYQTGLKRLNQLYAQHPDREIYASLPGAGELLEPALLAKLGEDRQRYPTPQILQAMAGTCPVTRQSGKTRGVFKRLACDREFRDIVQQWARLSLPQSPWAEAYYRSVRPQCGHENEAIRRLANRWLAVLWRLWQDRQPYQPEVHLQRHRQRCAPRNT